VGFTPEAYERMEGYSWPGNVRELGNAVERAVYLGKAAYIDAGDLMLESDFHPERELERPAPALPHRPERTAPPTGNLSIKADEKARIEQALRVSGGNVKKAAELLEISRRTLYRKMEKHRIDCGWIRENER
jgi:DNA-binding NtrC family response regulator